MSTAAAAPEQAPGGDATAGPRSLARPEWAPVIAAGLIIALASWNTVHKSLWVDEAYSLFTAHQSASATWHAAVRFELQPPLYFVLLNLWMRLGVPTIEWMRVLSTLATVGSVLFLWATARGLGPRDGAVVPLVAAITATVVWAAAEARAYGLALFFCGGTLYFWFRLLDGRSGTPRRDAVLYAVGAYASILTFYFAGFLLLGEWVAALVVGRARRNITLALTAVAVAITPWLPIVFSQTAAHVNPNRSLTDAVPGAALSGGIGMRLLSLLESAIFADAPVLHRNVGAIVILGLLLVAPIARWLPSTMPTPLPRRPDAGARVSPARWIETALVVTFVVPAACLIVLRATNAVVVFPRHMVCVAPSFVLLWSYWISHQNSVSRRVIAGAALGAACGIALVSYERHVDVADSRGAARYVALHGAPDEPILIVGPEAALPFRYYFQPSGHPAAPVFGVPTDVSLTVYDPSGFVLRDTAQIGTRVRAAAVRRTFWMLVWKDFLWRSAQSDSVVEDFLRHHAVVQDHAGFTNLDVMRVELR